MKNKIWFIISFFGVMIISYYVSGQIAVGFERGVYWGILHFSGLYFVYKLKEDKTEE